MPGPLNVHGGTGELIVSNAGTVFANGESLPTGPGFATGCFFVKTGSGAGAYKNTGTNDAASFVEVADGVGFIASGGGADSFILNDTDNDIDSTVQTSVILGPGNSSQPNKIGELDGLPVGTDFDPGWEADSGYVAGAAGVASILGGYDQIVNSTGSLIVQSNHSMISYGAAGHNTIVGNSYNWIAGDASRSSILGARQSSIQAGTFGLISGGDNNDITASGDYNSITDGLACAISSTASRSAILGGNAHTISAGVYGLIAEGNTCSITSSGNNNSIINGVSNTISGTANRGAIIGGTTNTLTGEAAVILGGSTNSNTKRSAVVAGEDGVAYVSGGMHLSRAKLVTVGDAQSITSVLAKRTTDATLTNLAATVGTDFIELNDAKWTTGTGKIWLVGMRDGSADGNNDADYTQVAYEVEFGFYWDGTNGFLFKTGTETAVTGSPTLDMNLISQTANDFTAGAAPHIAINTGSMRVKVTGIAATIINWVARIDLVMTAVE
jgi:hypothetical protein